MSDASREAPSAVQNDTERRAAALVCSIKVLEAVAGTCSRGAVPLLLVAVPAGEDAELAAPGVPGAAFVATVGVEGLALLAAGPVAGSVDVSDPPEG